MYLDPKSNPLRAPSRHLSGGPTLGTHLLPRVTYPSSPSHSAPKPYPDPACSTKDGRFQRVLVSAIHTIHDMWTLFTSLTHQSLIHWPTTPRPPGNCLEESQSAPRLHVTSCPTRSPLAHSPICCLVRPIPASRRPGSGLHRLGAQPRPINTHPDRARHPARHSRIASTPSSGLTSRAQSSSGFGFGRLEKEKKKG